MLFGGKLIVIEFSVGNDWIYGCDIGDFGKCCCLVVFLVSCGFEEQNLVVLLIIGEDCNRYWVVFMSLICWLFCVWLSLGSFDFGLCFMSFDLVRELILIFKDGLLMVGWRRVWSGIEVLLYWRTEEVVVI